MSSDRHQAEYLPFRCSSAMKDLIQQIAAQEQRPMSEVLRDLVEKGLAVSGAGIEQDHLYETVRQAVEEVTRPSVERLAKISAKATQISSAAFFMSIFAATRGVGVEEQTEIQEAAESARRLGIQYLKLKDRDIDAFIRDGTKQIIEEG